MASSPRAASIIVDDLEQRLKNLYTTRVHDEQTLNELESLLDECSIQLNRLISSSDPTLVAIILPSLLQTIISLSKNCADKSDIIISGPFLSRDKLTSLTTLAKTLHNQIKEFVKSPKFNSILTRSTQQRHFCEQLRLVSDGIANTDVLTTLICQKLIVKLLTGTDEQQQPSSSYVKIDDVNDGLVIAVYGSVLQQMGTICAKYFGDKTDNNKDSQTIKMYGIYFQMLTKLVQYNNTISQIESYTEFIRTMIQLQVCLESTCQQTRFQLEFFNTTILLQEILHDFLFYSLSNSSKLFFDDLFLEISSNKNKYASLILLFRSIEAFDITLTKQQNDFSIHFIHQFTFHLFDLIDECRVQLVLPALLPVSFNKTQVEYGSLYDITYSHLIRLYNQQSMQTILSSMNKLIQSSNEMISTSNQLASELIIQAWYSHNQSSQFQYLFGLFLAELLRLDVHSSLINHLLTMPNIQSVKFRAYDILISSETLHRIYDFFSTMTTNDLKEPMINSTNLSFIFPTNLLHLYSFIRLFNTELNSNQIQHTIDTCMYSIQQFLSLPIITDLTCKNFILTLRLVTYLTINNHESFKCLLGQLTQIFVILDEQTAIDVRLELLRVFAVHSNVLDDNDLGRLLDFMLTSSVESNANSISFHLGCLDVVDALRKRQARSSNITDLIIQLIVRYGNEHQTSYILKAHLMRIFMAYISNSNDDSLPMRVKSQCVLLRANVDEFEKIKKTMGTTNDRFPDENTLKVLDSTRPSMLATTTTTTRKDLLINEREAQLKFYQTIVDELEFHRCSISTQNPNAMQED